MHIGIDVGGSHVAAAAVDRDGNVVTKFRKAIDSNSPATTIFNEWAQVISNVVSASSTDVNINTPIPIAFAMPGPFDYELGVSQMVHKYPAIRGMNVGEELRSRLSMSMSMPFLCYLNDAEAWLRGEVSAQHLHDRNVVGITLGTGLGSCVMKEGVVVNTKPFFSMPYKDGIAEDYISSLALLSAYNGDCGNVLELANEAMDANEDAVNAFKQFGVHLGQFLSPILMEYDRPLLIIGGGIAHAWKHFVSHLSENVETETEILPSRLFEDAAVIGAANFAREKYQFQLQCRTTKQALLPLTYSHKSPLYDPYPIHKRLNSSSSSSCSCYGWESLVNVLESHVNVSLSDSGRDSDSGDVVFVMDGCPGIMWDMLAEKLKWLRKSESKSKYKYRLFASHSVLKSEEQINELVMPYLGGDDPLFGKSCGGDLNLIDFFDESLLENMRNEITESSTSTSSITVIYGSGASLIPASSSSSVLFYWDLPKNEEQYRSRAVNAKNLGCSVPLPPKVHYKRSYFVDWPVMRKHMQSIVQQLDYIVDGQRDIPTWLDGVQFREHMRVLGSSQWRARPWFEPGPWGGQWMVKNMPHLPPEPNYAWSFELIAPENGLVLACKCACGVLVEVAHDWLMICQAEHVLGKKAFDRFQLEFPIRFDYLDTIDGGNLSIQVHPSTETIAGFGETFTQDESYYIVTSGGGDVGEPRVYLGLKGGIDIGEFRKKLEDDSDIDIDKYVNSFASKKGDYFVIPNGTIHGSGKDNVVLEISSTPYIFTFKLHDWKRLGLDGLPRPLNIDRGFANLRPESRPHVQPHCETTDVNAASETLPTADCMPFNVERLYMKKSESRTVQCGGSCHVLNIVDGCGLNVTVNGESVLRRLHETWAVSAAAVLSSPPTASEVQTFSPMDPPEQPTDHQSVEQVLLTPEGPISPIIPKVAGAADTDSPAAVQAQVQSEARAIFHRLSNDLHDMENLFEDVLRENYALKQQLAMYQGAPLPPGPVTQRFLRADNEKDRSKKSPWVDRGTKPQIKDKEKDKDRERMTALVAKGKALKDKVVHAVGLGLGGKGTQPADPEDYRNTVWQPVGRYSGHRDGVWEVTTCPLAAYAWGDETPPFGSSNILVATASADRTSRIWFGPIMNFQNIPGASEHASVVSNWRDRERLRDESLVGTCLAVYTGHRGSVNSVRFHRRRPRFVLTASGDASIHIWKIPSLMPEMDPDAGAEAEPEADAAESDSVPRNSNGSGIAGIGPWRPLLGDGDVDGVGDSDRKHSATSPHTQALADDVDEEGDANVNIDDREYERDPEHALNMNMNMSGEDGTMLLNEDNDELDEGAGAGDDDEHDEEAHAQVMNANDPHSPASSRPARKLYPMSVRAALMELNGHEDVVAAAAWLSSGDQVVSGSYDTTLKIWHAETGKVLSTLNGHDKPLTNVSPHPFTDDLVISAGRDSFRVWDTRTTGSAEVCTGHIGPVTSAIYNGNGDMIVSGGDDRTIKLWDCRSLNTPVQTMEASSGVNRLSVSNQHGYIAAPFDDANVRVYDPRVGTRRVARIGPSRSGHRRIVCSAAWTPDESLLFTSGFDPKQVVVFAPMLL